MCGIAGYFLTTNRSAGKTRAAFAVMAIEMETRGTDSWGTLDSNGNVAKGLGKVRHGLTIPAALPQAMVAHTRYATTGKITSENSHPFTFTGDAGTVSGVHNGIISNHFELNQKHGRKLSVDSMHIFAHLASGIPLDDLTGYGAIVYMHDGEWYIGRFNGGELHVEQTELGYFWASTSAALDSGLRVAGIAPGKRLSLKDGRIYRIANDGLHKHAKIDAAYISFKWDDVLTSNHNRSDTTLDTCDAYISDDDYTVYVSEGSFDCDACGEPIPSRSHIYDIHYEGVDICRSCFHSIYTTQRMAQ